MKVEGMSLKGLESYLHCRFVCARETELSGAPDTPHRFVTLSRQTGAGGITIGTRLAKILNQHNEGKCKCLWTVFDKDLLRTVLEEHKLPERYAEYMSEQKVSVIQDTLDEIVGLHPSMLTLARETAETILRLARLGNTIIVGRGANVITRNLQGGYHVRLVGSLGKRLQHVMEYYHVGSNEAAERIQKEDRGRKGYLKQNFGKNIDDPSLYDVVMNTDDVPYDEAAKKIAHAVLKLNEV